MIPCQFRGVLPNDIPLIMDAWLAETRHSAFAKFIDSRIYRAGHHKLLERILKRSKVLIACNPEDPSHVFGFFVFEESPTVYCHWLYIKQAYRGQGLAREMLRFVVPSILTPAAPQIACSHTGKLFLRKRVVDPETGARIGDADNDTVTRYRLAYNPYPLFNLSNKESL